MKGNAELVTQLTKEGIVQSDAIEKALQTVDRGDFVQPIYRADAYEDYPLPIGGGQTISQPATVAFMLELLDPAEGEKILDVGAGSGWTTAILAHIAGDSGQVIGTERLRELVAFADENLSKYDFSNTEVIDAGAELGCPSEAPYDRILVSASARELPDTLINQLKTGGAMVIPVQEAIWKVVKDSDGSLSVEKYPGFAFVPLIGD